MCSGLRPSTRRASTLRPRKSYSSQPSSPNSWIAFCTVVRSNMVASCVAEGVVLPSAAKGHHIPEQAGKRAAGDSAKTEQRDSGGLGGVCCRNWGEEKGRVLYNGGRDTKKTSL